MLLVNIPYANSSLFTYDKAKIFHASRPVLNRSFIFFCLFHRLDKFICYISDFFLPSRERTFGDNVPNCVYQYNHCIEIFEIYSKHPRTV